jgi:NADPH-dependent ferric siderophore reductase
MAATAMLARPFPLHTGVSILVRRRALTPRMARFTLHDPAFADLGVEEPGEILTLGWCEPGEELVLPQVGWRFPAGAREQHWRNFTVRAYRPEAAELEVDFFLHGDIGRASAWAARAVPGDAVGFAGPRMHWQASDDDADWTLLAADETGLPALLAILETLPAGHRAIALAEIHDDDERQPVETDADVDLRWLSRGGRPPGTTTVLADEAARLDLPEGTGRAWGGGEALAMRGVRDALRAAGLPRSSMDVMGYWKHRLTPDDVDY